MHYLGEACAFVATLVFAWIYDWRAADLVWSLWLSSLSVGYLIMVSQCLQMPVGVLRGAIAERANFTVGQIVLGTVAVLAFNGFVLAFFTLHFGLFHLIHGAILSHFFPLAMEYPMKPWQLPHFALELFPQYYGMVLASAFVQRRLILKPEGLQRVEEPYKGVLRMHLLIFVFFALYALGATNFVFYGVTLAVYFYPWEELKRKKAFVAASADGLQRSQP